jgi:hypothetical protein
MYDCWAGERRRFRSRREGCSVACGGWVRESIHIRKRVGRLTEDGRPGMASVGRAGRVRAQMRRHCRIGRVYQSRRPRVRRVGEIEAEETSLQIRRGDEGWTDADTGAKLLGTGVAKARADEARALRTESSRCRRRRTGWGCGHETHRASRKGWRRTWTLVN